MTSDHGEAFGEHGDYFHGRTLYNESVHVPLLIWGPSIPAARYDAPRSLIDVPTTILGLAGLSIPEHMCGEDLSEGLRSGAMPSATPVYIEVLPDHTTPHFVVSLIDGPLKLIHYPLLDVQELFDLEADPLEQHNLADREPERAQKMINALRKLYESRGIDPLGYGLAPP
jgi:arylsulfatase A-like enzyme